MKFFDTHIHLNSEQLFPKFHEFINKYAGCYFLIVGTGLEDSKLAVEMSEKYPVTCCAVGIHPLDVNIDDQKTVFVKLTNLIKNNKKIVAIGETGLDFYKTTKEESYEKQVNSLIEHGELCKKFNLPLVIHSRNSNSELIELLKKNPEWFGVIHSFFGTEKELDEFLALDKWMLSISPLFFRHDIYKKLIPKIPLERLLVETDAPWLCKDSSTILQIIEEIAKIKNMDKNNLAEQLLKNSQNFFKLNS